MKWKRFHNELVMTIPGIKEVPSEVIKYSILILITIVVAAFPAFDSSYINVIKEEIPKSISCLIGIQWLYTTIFSLVEFIWSIICLTNYPTKIPDIIFWREVGYRVAVIGMHFTTTYVQLIIIKRNINWLVALAAGTIIHLTYNLIVGG